MRIGKITENTLKRSVLKQIRTEYKGIKSAAAGSDCAFSKEERVFSAASPMELAISDMGFYAVVKAANSLAAQGITPDHVTLTILLPPDAEEKELKIVVASAIEGARVSGTTYAGGHTQTSTAVNRPIVVAEAAGYALESAEGRSPAPGKALEEAEGRNLVLESAEGRLPAPGDDIVVAGWIALEGTAIIAHEKKEELATRYPVPFIEKAERFKELVSIRRVADLIYGRGEELPTGDGIFLPNAHAVNTLVHDLSQGGVYAALWEFAERAGCGLKADLKKIPIRQESIEICEFFEINPYQLLSGGSLLVATPDGEKLAEFLEDNGIPAAVIGSFEKGKDRLIINDDESRFLELPQPDEIYKVF